MSEVKPQAAAYHGIANAKYSLRGTDGKPGSTVVDLLYAKSISFEPQVDEQAVYANDQKVLALVSDKGFTGSLGTTAQDRALEKGLGHIVDVAQGVATVNLISYKRADVYYEYKETTPSATYTVKVWVLNVEISKPSSVEHNTDEEQPTIGEYAYPITVYGDKIQNSTGTGTYRDANGNELVATKVISLPGDDGYDTFGDAVPVVKMASA